MVTKAVVGVAGGGKTSYAMSVIENELRAGLKWHEIGFCSFSRAACAEAAERAARMTGESVDRLQKFGYFKTIHACALRCLGVDPKCILDCDSADGKKFLVDAVGSTRGGERGSLAEKVDTILSAWDLLRARLTLMTGAGSQRSGTPNQRSGTPGHLRDTFGTPFCAKCPGAEVGNSQGVTSAKTPENRRPTRRARRI